MVNDNTAALDFTFDILETGKKIPFEFSPGLGIFISTSFFALWHWRKKRANSK